MAAIFKSEPQGRRMPIAEDRGEVQENSEKNTLNVETSQLGGREDR